MEISVDIFDPIGFEVIRAIEELDPTLEMSLVEGQYSDVPFETTHPRLLIKSRNRSVAAPLVIILGYTFEIFWHRGYFFDFYSPNVQEISKFFKEFFEERVVCTNWIPEDAKAPPEVEVFSGGPVWPYDDWRQTRDWKIGTEVLEIRSWLGNFDKDIWLVAGNEVWDEFAYREEDFPRDS